MDSLWSMLVTNILGQRVDADQQIRDVLGPIIRCSSMPREAWEQNTHFSPAPEGTGFQ